MVLRWWEAETGDVPASRTSAPVERWPGAVYVARWFGFGWYFAATLFKRSAESRGA